MSNENVGGADNQLPGGAVDDKKNQGVSHETYLRVMDELKELKRKNAEYDDKTRADQEKILKDQNDWKALADAKEKQANEWKQKFEGLDSTLVTGIKLSAFQKHLGGKLTDDEYFSFVDTDKIAYNPETKKVDEESVKAVVAEFVKKHSKLVDFGKKQTRLPGDAPKGLGGTKDASGKSISDMTPAELDAHIIYLAKNGKLKEQE